MARYRIGIDFGTTFCFAGFLQNGEVRPLIPTSETYGIPSVFYADQRQVLVGREAERQARVRPAGAVRSVKRHLQERGALLRVDGKEYHALDIVQEILSYIVRNAEKLLRDTYVLPFGKDDRMEAVITVPVSLPEPARALLRRAAAGVRLSNGSRLLITGILPEPVAAAIHYFGLTLQKEKTILVFDLGGGTLDLALVHARDTDSQGSATIPYEVLDMEGDLNLGGDDWDAAIRGWLVRQYRSHYGSIIPARIRDDFLEEARNMKITLSSARSAMYSVDVREDIMEGRLGRVAFEKLTSDLVMRALSCVDRLMKRHEGLLPDNIVLTGGGSRMPMIMNALRWRFPSVRLQLTDPEHAIAYGAARYADTLAWDELRQETGKTAKLVETISTHGYGILFYFNGELRVQILIPRGSVLPYSASTISTVREPGRTGFRFEVYETDEMAELKEKLRPATCRKVMEVNVDALRPLPVGARFRNVITLTEDGLLTVRSTDLTTRQGGRSQIRLSRVLTPTERRT